MWHRMREVRAWSKAGRKRKPPGSGPGDERLNRGLGAVPDVLGERPGNRCPRRSGTGRAPRRPAGSFPAEMSEKTGSQRGMPRHPPCAGGQPQLPIRSLGTPRNSTSRARPRRRSASPMSRPGTGCRPAAAGRTPSEGSGSLPGWRSRRTGCPSGRRRQRSCPAPQSRALPRPSARSTRPACPSARRKACVGSASGTCPPDWQVRRSAAFMPAAAGATSASSAVWPRNSGANCRSGAAATAWQRMAARPSPRSWRGCRPKAPAKDGSAMRRATVIARCSRSGMRR